MGCKVLPFARLRVEEKEAAEAGGISEENMAGGVLRIMQSYVEDAGIRFLLKGRG